MCIMCMGELEDKPTTFTVEIDGIIYIVRNVPSHVCHQCGAVSYSQDVSQRLEDIVLGMKSQVGRGELASVPVTCNYTVASAKKAA